MKIAAFSIKPYDRDSLAAASAGTPLEWIWLEPRLDRHTARLAEGAAAVNCFVNDELDAAALEVLAFIGVRLVTLRSAGFNHVDVAAAARLGLAVTRVPDYSPHAVAEHTAGLMLTLDRKLHRAYGRVRDGNFSLQGLLGFGCHVLAHDLYPDAALAARGVVYLPLDDLLAGSDIVTLHCPLAPSTHHLVNAASIARMRPGVMLVNTSRGGLVDTQAVIDALKSGHIGHLGLDVYEEEAGLFFDDKSSSIIQDDTFMRLLTFPNVVVTAHQAFFTSDALAAIATQTVRNLLLFHRGEPLEAIVGA